jgi:hypothetical protein
MVATDSNSINYYPVRKTMKLQKQLLGFDGYVMGKNKLGWQKDRNFSLNKDNVQAFLRSKLGYLPPGTTWEQAKVICLVYHCVEKIPLPDGSLVYRCDCKAYWHVKECSHVTSAKHLDGVQSLESLLREIPHARLPGRPRKPVPVGYSAHAPIVPVVPVIHPANFLGLQIARRCKYGSDRMYIGKVCGAYMIIWLSYFILLLFYFDRDKKTSI